MRLTLFCKHSDFIAHLLRENEWLKTQALHERQRAEIAIDELLRLRTGAGPVSLPLSRDAEAAVEDKIAALGVNPEFTGAGDAT